MLASNNKIHFLIACLGLVGCLNSEDKKSTLVESSSEVSIVALSSVSADKSCNTGRDGVIVYDRTQSQFFTCIDGQWSVIDLRGPKGDKGDTGADGQSGVAGAPGVNGVNGANGRDGLDGNGIRLALKENGQVKGILINYEWVDGTQKALMMLPNGDLIYIDVNTGFFSGKPWLVYFTGAGCTGDAYTGRTDAFGPHVPGRIYVGVNNSRQPVAFYKAEEWVPSQKAIKSSREYNTEGQMHQCKEREGEYASVLVRVEEIPAIPPLDHLKPIKFSP